MSVTGRGTARRGQILAATLRVVAAAGVDGVTHRAVAAEAGVPLGAMTYYFESRDDLITQAFATAAEQSVDRIRALAEELWPQPTIAASIDATTQALLDVLADRPTCRALCELHLAAARLPGLQQIAARVDAESERIVTRLLDELGTRDPGGAARLVLAAVDGLVLRQLALPGEPVDGDELRGLVRRLLTTLSEPAESDDAGRLSRLRGARGVPELGPAQDLAPDRHQGPAPGTGRPPGRPVAGHADES